jgi:hypothetical protein
MVHAAFYSSDFTLSSIQASQPYCYRFSIIECWMSTGFSMISTTSIEANMMQMNLYQSVTAFVGSDFRH